MIVNVIPHDKQAYDTAGNYTELMGCWCVELSRMDDWRYEACLFIHEFVEMCLTRLDGVEWKDIDAFDMGPGKDSDDPGTMPEAPYHKQHMLATVMERKMCQLLGVDWEEYDKAFGALDYKHQKEQTND